jgi:SAGA-associated factor 29
LFRLKGVFISQVSLYFYFMICLRPPPLCGAVPADSNHVCNKNDKIAARVRSSEGEENWILASVVSFNPATNKYEVDDIDAEEGKE